MGPGRDFLSGFFLLSFNILYVYFGVFVSGKVVCYCVKKWKRLYKYSRIV